MRSLTTKKVLFFCTLADKKQDLELDDAWQVFFGFSGIQNNHSTAQFSGSWLPCCYLGPCLNYKYKNISFYTFILKYVM